MLLSALSLVLLLGCSWFFSTLLFLHFVLYGLFYYCYSKPFSFHSIHAIWTSPITSSCSCIHFEYLILISNMSSPYLSTVISFQFPSWLLSSSILLKCILALSFIFFCKAAASSQNSLPFLCAKHVWWHLSKTSLQLHFWEIFQEELPDSQVHEAHRSDLCFNELLIKLSLKNKNKTAVIWNSLQREKA